MLAELCNFKKLKVYETWHFVNKIVPTYCEKKSVLVTKKKVLKFEAEGREFATFLRSLEQFIQTVKGRTIFGNRILF